MQMYNTFMIMLQLLHITGPGKLDELTQLQANLKNMPEEIRAKIFADLLDAEIEEGKFIPKFKNIAILAKNYGLVTRKSGTRRKPGTWKDNLNYKFAKRCKEKSEKLLLELDQQLKAADITTHDVIKRGVDAPEHQGQYSRENESPLHSAARNNKKDIAELLIHHGAKLNIESITKLTPLHCASFNNYPDIVKLLLANGADVDARDDDQKTPLRWVAIEGHLEIAKLLIAHGANVNAQDKDGQTPLQWAAMNGRMELAQLLIEHDADITLADKEGFTPLYLAQMLNHRAMVTFLKQKLKEQQSSCAIS